MNNIGPAYKIIVSSVQAWDDLDPFDDVVVLILNVKMRWELKTPNPRAQTTIGASTKS